jgi:hypothetical protein
MNRKLTWSLGICTIMGLSAITGYFIGRNNGIHLGNEEAARRLDSIKRGAAESLRYAFGVSREEIEETEGYVHYFQIASDILRGVGE